MPANCPLDNPVPSTKTESSCPDCMQSERYCLCAHVDPVGAKTEILVLNGTWSQGKARWRRNSWLLGAQRLVVRRDQKSLYDTLRKQPGRGGLSSIEALAEASEPLEAKKGEMRKSIQAPLGELVGRLDRGHKRYRSRSYRGGRYG